jgi:DNA-binding NtrC family response regulator
MGLVTSATPTLPLVSRLSTRSAPLVIVDAVGPWTRSDLVKSVAAIARKTSVIILVDSKGFQERVELARASGARVLPRSQDPRKTISFVAEAIERRVPRKSTVFALNIGGGLLDTLSHAMAGRESCLEVLNEPSAFWSALEERGADLAILGFTGRGLSGPELCRVIRRHPYWHRLPVFVVGAQDATQFADAMNAGADDYLISGTSPGDLAVRLSAYIEWRRLTGAGWDMEPFVETENRAIAEQALYGTGAENLILDGSRELSMS